MGAIRILCEACGKRGKVPDKYAGKKIKCPDCAEKIRVPAIEYSDAELAPDAGDPRVASASSRMPPAQARKTSSRRAGSSSGQRKASGKTKRPSGQTKRPSASAAQPKARSASGTQKAASGRTKAKTGKQKAIAAKAPKKLGFAKKGKKPAAKGADVKKKGFKWEPKIKRGQGGPKGDDAQQLVDKRNASSRRKKMFLGLIIGLLVLGIVGWLGFGMLRGSMTAGSIATVANGLQPGQIPSHKDVLNAVPRSATIVAVAPSILVTGHPEQEVDARQVAVVGVLLGAWHADPGAASIPKAKKPAADLLGLLESLKRTLDSDDANVVRGAREAFRGVWDYDSLEKLKKLGQAAEAKVQSTEYRLQGEDTPELRKELEDAKIDVAWYHAYYQHFLGESGTIDAKAFGEKISHLDPVAAIKAKRAEELRTAGLGPDGKPLKPGEGGAAPAPEGGGATPPAGEGETPPADEGETPPAGE